MKTPPIPPIKMPEGDLGQLPQRQYQQYAATKGQPTDNAVSDIITPSFENHINLNKLENTNAQYHDLAQQIRDVKETMESIGVNLSEMRDALESIVKIFPPYPPGSSERIEALRQFTALRNMIDQLTAPQTNDGMDNIMADPDIHPHAGNLQIANNSSGKRLTITHQPVHTGKTGLDLPHLDLNSSDQHISAAIENIITAQKSLGNRQLAFESNANGVISKIS